MPIQAQLVLPPYLKSNFIDDDFLLNSGEVYFTGKLSLSPHVTENKVTLVFGLKLLDINDRTASVQLKTIKRLELSNDPSFHPNSTITLTDWPYSSASGSTDKVAGSNLNYKFTINPNSFHDPNNYTALGARTTVDPGTELFIIENWPLSANGGLSTIYIKIQAQDTSNALGTFPSGAGLFDQIYWQPETGVRPGVPKLVTRSESNYTGKKSLIRFEAAQEGASNLFGTGVARYVGDIIEHRPLLSTDTGYERQFSSNRTSTIFRNIVPNVSPDVSIGAISLRRYTFNTTNRNMAAASPSTLAANTTETASLSAGNGIRLQPQQDGRNIATIKAPDFFSQAHVKVQMSNALGEYKLTLGLFKAVPDSNPPSESKQLEIVLNVSNGSYAYMPQAKVIKRTSVSTEATLQTTTISRKIIKDLEDGGNLEIYVAKLRRPSSSYSATVYTKKFLVRAFFTADSDKTKSYLLGSAVVDDFPELDYTAGSNSGEVLPFILFESITGTINYTFNELASGTGRLLLDVDLGDCKTDEILVDNSLSTRTTFDYWASAITNEDWKTVKARNSATLTSSSNSFDLEASNPSTDGINRSYGELLAVYPTFSDRAKITFDLKLLQGQFYVALSPKRVWTYPSTYGRPMGERCDSLSENTLEFINQPTLMVLFDQERKNIRCILRKQDNTIDSLILVGAYSNSVPANLTGTISWSNSALITGTGTKFYSELKVGESIYKTDGTFIGKIKFISSNTSLTVVEPLNSVQTPINFRKFKSIYAETIELTVTNSPIHSEGTWVTIKKNGELLNSLKLSGTLPSAENGTGWYVALGVRQNLATDFGGEGNAPTNKSSLAAIGTVEIVGLPPKITLEDSDLVNQRHFQKSTGGAAYQKPFLGQVMLAGNTEFQSFIYKSNHRSLNYRYFVQEITPKSRTSGETSLWPQLFEILVEDTRQVIPNLVENDGPEIKFFNKTNDTIGTQIFSSWLGANTSETITGFNVPNNKLIQFDLGKVWPTNTPLTSGTSYFVVIKLPKGVVLAKAKGFDRLSKELFKNSSDSLLEGVLEEQGGGWQLIPWLWFKLFHSFRERFDNVYDNATQHYRLLAESHALVSSDASGLSERAIVDISGPVADNNQLSFFSVSSMSFGSLSRPAVTTALQPGTRSTMLNINAKDLGSGVWLFRVVRETDFGMVFYTDWQDWEAFKKRNNTGELEPYDVFYVVYHYGSWWKDEDNNDDPFTNSQENAPQNLGTDGPRKIWVEVMDKVGNISQSYPITVNAQLLALVDTDQPEATVETIQPDGAILDFTNQKEVIVKVNSSDITSSPMALRYRLIDQDGTGPWSGWFPYSDILRVPLLRDSSPQFDVAGLKRIEVQPIDYGLNKKQESDVWNIFSKDTYAIPNVFAASSYQEIEKNIIYVDSVTWLDPKTNKEAVFFSAIRFFDFLASELVLVPVSWNITNEKAFEVVSKANGLYNRKIYVGNTDTIRLTINNVIYNRASSSSDNTVQSPKFYIDQQLGYLIVQTASSINLAQVECSITRSEAQIWRWDRVSFDKVADLSSLGERVIICMQALQDRILLGSGNGKLWTFDGLNIRGPIFQTSDLSGNSIPITSLSLHQFIHEQNSFIYLGTGTKAFIYRAPVNSYLTSSAWSRLNVEPIYDKSFNITAMTSAYDALFISTNSGKVFKYNRKLNKTDGTTVTELAATFDLKKSDIDVYESNILPVADLLSFSNQVIAAIGDRPEVHSYTEKLRSLPGLNGEIIPDIYHLRLTNVKLATTAALTGTWTATNSTLTRSTTGVLSIDGVNTAVNDRVLINNQVNKVHNGIYVVTRNGNGNQALLTRAMDCAYLTKHKGNTSVFVTHGTTNASKYWYLKTSDYIEFGVDINEWDDDKVSFAHFYSSWTNTNFTKFFLQSPGNWQFYYDGDTNPRERPDVVRAIQFDDKFTESGVKEAVIVTGVPNKASVFTLSAGSDWEQAVNRIRSVKEPFSLDFELRHEFGSGAQGFEVADGYHIVNVKFSTSAVTVTSGTSSITRNFFNRNDVFTPYSIVEQQFPQLGNIKIWNFAQYSASEDTNPATPEGSGEASAQGWFGKEFATVAAKTEPGNMKIIEVDIATTESIDAITNYFDGPEPASPGIGAYLEYTTTGAKTIDGIGLAITKTVLVKDQINKNENGIYEVTVVGSDTIKVKLTRSTLFDEKSEALKSTVVLVKSGLTNANKYYYIRYDGQIDIGFEPIDWYNTAILTNVGEDHYLEVSALADGVKGDPIIGVENLTPIIADTNTYILIRFRIIEPSDIDTSIDADFDDYVKTVTTANITSFPPTGAQSSSATFANVAIAEGDKVLVNSQTDPTQNGVYVVPTENPKTWVRLEVKQSKQPPQYASPADYLLKNYRLKATAGDYKDRIFTLSYNTVKLDVGKSYIKYYESASKPSFNLKTYWGNTGKIPELGAYRYVSTEITMQKDYNTYMIKPAWLGPVRSLYFEFENFSSYLFYDRVKIHIDYISILTNAGHFTIQREFTPVRIALSGTERTDLRLWVGKYEDPIIEVDNFANQESNESYIRFGKLDPNPSRSSWMWSNLKYQIGNVIPPVVPEVQGFYPSFRFTSSGGVRKIVQHAGTIWCLTDGFYNKASTDNPDDLLFKAWSYAPDKQIWIKESPNSSRISATRGMVRALTATSFDNTLLVAGQVGTVTNEKSLPG